MIFVKVGRVITLFGAFVMVVLILHGLINGDFIGEGSAIYGMLWGKIAFIEIYIMIFIFAAWIWYREPSLFVATLWVAALLALGSIIALLYLARAFRQSAGNWDDFFKGHPFFE